MKVFAVQLSHNAEAEHFFAQTHERLKIGLVFGAVSKPILKKDSAIYTLLIDHNFPKFHLYVGFPLVALSFILHGFVYSPLFWVGMGFLCLDIFFSATFIYIILRFGLRKSGYRGKYKRLTKEKHLYTLATNLIEQGTNRR